MKKIWMTILIAALLVLPHVAFAAGEPTVTITLDKESVEVGETVTVHYEIMGTGKYKDISWATEVWTTENTSQSPVEYGELKGLMGSFACVPRFGIAMEVSIGFEDETGRYYHYESDKIRISGYSVVDPVVTIVLDKENTTIGEKVTVNYEITGAEKYQNISWATEVWTTENISQSPVEYGELKGLMGSFACAPRFGIAMEVSIGFEDGTGRYYHYESNKIPIEGYISDYDIYTVTEGQNTQISTGENSLTFRADGAFEKYLGVQVDGKSVPDKHVKAWSGSTYVELSAEYLASLLEGEHELTIIFDDGVAVTTFATANAQPELPLPELPKTGDTSLPMAYLLMTMAVSVGVFGLLAKKRIN